MNHFWINMLNHFSIYHFFEPILNNYFEPFFLLIKFLLNHFHFSINPVVFYHFCIYSKEGDSRNGVELQVLSFDLHGILRSSPYSRLPCQLVRWLFFAVIQVFFWSVHLSDKRANCMDLTVLFMEQCITVDSLKVAHL